MNRKRLTCSIVILISLLVATGEASALTERQKIDALLEAIGRSNLVFIRNGTEYSAARAVSHLRLKLDRAGDRIRSAEMFITYLASKSSMTGEPYSVRLPDGHSFPAAEWLRAELRKIEKSN